MAIEYRLSYTASEIDTRLGMIDNMVKSVNNIVPDENGNVAINERTYELIETVEVTEENVGAIKLFHNLDKLILYINCPIAADTINCGIDVYKNNTLAGYAWLSGIANSTSARIGYFEAKNENGLVVCENTTPQNSIERPANAALHRKAWHVDGQGPFTQVKVFGGNGAYFPVGTIFELWGIEAQ